jgi:hypothetical protein
MTLGDSLGPWWVAWRGPLQTTPHAPPYGWFLALPYAAILAFARSLWQAEAALLVLHALVAPLGALLAAAQAPRRWAPVAALSVGGLVAVDPGLLDTAISGAEGYLGALWLGILVWAGPRVPPGDSPGSKFSRDSKKTKKLQINYSKCFILCVSNPSILSHGSKRNFQRI